MLGDHDFDYNSEELDENHIGHLLHQTNILRSDSSLSEARELCHDDTVIFLHGLGLTSEEIELFQKHEIGFEKFDTLTCNDLDYLGITSKEKKKRIAHVQQYRKQKSEKSLQHRPSLEINLDAIFRSEDSQAMENVLKHQQTLIKILPYFTKDLNKKIESTFFRSGFSVNHTFEKVALCCAQQAHQVQDQLRKYLLELEQISNQQHKKQNKKLWSRQNQKWWFLALLVGSCIPLLVWSSRKAYNLPIQWTKMRHLLSLPVSLG